MKTKKHRHYRDLSPKAKAKVQIRNARKERGRW